MIKCVKIGNIKWTDHVWGLKAINSPSPPQNRRTSWVRYLNAYKLGWPDSSNKDFMSDNASSLRFFLTRSTKLSYIIQHSSSSESSSSEILNYNMTKLNTINNIHVIGPTLYVIIKSKLRRVTKKTIILSSLFTSLSSAMIFTQIENTVGHPLQKFIIIIY